MPNHPKLIEKIEEYLKTHLTKHRCEHVLSVRDQSVKLAKLHNINSDKSELAALLHDSLKEIPNNELLQYANEHGLLIDTYEEKNISLLHGKLAPFFAKNQFGIDDEVVNNAMRNHTTGSAVMGPVDKVLFVSDFCEPLRLYNEADSVRALAENDLEEAAFEVIKHKIKKNLSKNRIIHPDCFNAYNAMSQNRTKLNTQ